MRRDASARLLPVWDQVRIESRISVASALATEDIRLNGGGFKRRVAALPARSLRVTFQPTFTMCPWRRRARPGESICLSRRAPALTGCVIAWFAQRSFPTLRAAPLSAATLAINPNLGDPVVILILAVSLLCIILIAAAFYLYKIFAESRRVSSLIRENLTLDRQALELARQSLILSQPPKLIIRSVEVRPRPFASGEPFHVFPPDSTIECRFLVKNVGGSRATVLFSAVTLFLIPHSETPPDGLATRRCNAQRSSDSQMHLKPGEITFGIFVRRTTSDEATSIKDLYVLGWVDYVDEFGNLRHTNFCRMYVRGRFARVEDRDYEDE